MIDAAKWFCNLLHVPSQAKVRPSKSVDLASLESRLLFDAAGLVAEAVAAQATDAVAHGMVDPQSVENHLIPPLAAIATPQLAFPGAEGMGAYAQGGRGGDVYVVTNLLDDGVGSLRYGVTHATGPRTIVFAVSGVIDLQTRLIINQPYLTITGQTAPGDGITLTGETVIISDTHDIILRYLRIRPGDEHPSAPRTHDSLTVANSHDIMLDHLSLSWAIDEIFNSADVENITLQWSIISEPLVDSVSPGGELGYNALSYRSSISIHHNLIAHGSFRMPRVTDGSTFDITNNVIYNWSRSMPISVGTNTANVPISYGNIESNVFIAGPSIGSFDPHLVFWGKDASQIYFAGNILDADLNGVYNPEHQIVISPTDLATFVDERFDFSHITIQSAGDAYYSVLNLAGASIVRDAIDERVVLDVINQTGSTIDSPSDVGGLPPIADYIAHMDSDGDGMPDYWENAFDYLDAYTAGDGNVDSDGNGWSNFEDFLNQHTTEAMLRLQPLGVPYVQSAVEVPRAPLASVMSNVSGGMESPWTFLHSRIQDDDQDE